MSHFVTAVQGASFPYLVYSLKHSFQQIFSVNFTEYLKPIAAKERELEAQRAKDKAELDAVRKAEADKSEKVCHVLLSFRDAKVEETHEC